MNIIVAIGFYIDYRQTNYNTNQDR